MHESSLAKQLLDVVLDRAEAVDAKKILKVSGWIADAETLTIDAIQFHFAAHARDTIADGAHLDLVLTRVAACCNDCGNRYYPDHHMTLCPECGSVDGTLEGQVGVGLETIDYR